MSKSAKYVPKHRDVPTRSISQAPRKALRNTVVLSSVAVAATGVAVSGGVATGPAAMSSAAEDIGSTVIEPLDSEQAAERVADRTSGRRDVTLSRSADRRAAADPAKLAELSVSDGPALNRTEDASGGDPREIARALLGEFGFPASEFGCLDSLWTRESNWNPAAQNASSGAFGIPQSLPGSKMASAGADWATNPVTQIRWGLGYIQDRYGSPCGAWGHSESSGWY